jgi:hypothetical protein
MAADCVARRGRTQVPTVATAGGGRRGQRPTATRAAAVLGSPASQGDVGHARSAKQPAWAAAISSSTCPMEPSSWTTTSCSPICTPRGPCWPGAGQGGRGNAWFPARGAPSLPRAGERAEPARAAADAALVDPRKVHLDLALSGQTKIALPFTTLRPHLGVVRWRAIMSCSRRYARLIEVRRRARAGHQFLRHQARVCSSCCVTSLRSTGAGLTNRRAS